MPDEQAAPRRWACTREQLIDAIAGYSVSVKLTGPAASLVVADCLADAILAELPELEPATLSSAESVTLSRAAVECVLLDHAAELSGDAVDANLAELAYCYREATGWDASQEIADSTAAGEATAP